MRRSVAAAAAVIPIALVAAAGGSPARVDPLATEIARWDAALREADAADPFWKDVRAEAEPDLERARSALADGHRLLALLRLAPVHETLTAAAYVHARPAAERKDLAAFEAEWAREGARLAGPGLPPALDGLRPALLRAMAEAAAPQARTYHDASLEYGRNTGADNGFFYLGAARAARDFAAVARRLSVPARLAAPPLRGIARDLAALEDEMLAAYRPPLSIEKHRDFIAASAALKEARELDTAGLRYGAVLRYLQAAARFAALRVGAPRPTRDLAESVRRFDAGLAAGVDHSLGRVFVEEAQEDLARHPDSGAAVAQAIADAVLPRYAAILAPAPPVPPPVAPKVTVTLVRWPYT